MKFALTLLAALFILPTLAPTSADAKRGIKLSVFKKSGSSRGRRTRSVVVVTPRAANDDSRNVVLVRELPDIAAYKKTSLFYDLGWKHSFPSGGEWVGYLPGPAFGYVNLDQTKVTTELLPSLGVTQADIPPRRSFFDGLSKTFMWVMIIALGLMGLGTFVAFIRSFGSKADESDQVAFAR